jgi:hypothetical protein
VPAGGSTIEVRDYDTDGADGELVEHDECNGDPYVRAVYESAERGRAATNETDKTTPWATQDFGALVRIHDATGKYLFSLNGWDRELAALIVRAVNSHDALVDACRAMAALTEYDHGQCGKCGAEAPGVTLTDGEVYDTIWGALCEDCVADAARAALALAGKVQP